jgi:hypothetical protein
MTKDKDKSFSVRKKKPLSEEPEMKELHRQVEAGKIDPKRLKEYLKKEKNHVTDSEG